MVNGLFAFVVCGPFIDLGFGARKWRSGVLGLSLVDDGA